MKTGRRGFLKGLFGVAVAPLLPKVTPNDKSLWYSRHGTKKEIAQNIDIDYLGERDDEIYVGPAVPADFTPGYPRGCRFVKTDTKHA